MWPERSDCFRKVASLDKIEIYLDSLDVFLPTVQCWEEGGRLAVIWVRSRKSITSLNLICQLSLISVKQSPANAAL